MLRIRALVNAELIAEDGKGNEEVKQIGAGTYFEATHVEVYEEDGETLANITLKDGEFKILGVSWNSHTFENHGVPEERRIKPVVKAPIYMSPQSFEEITNWDKANEVQTESTERE